MNDLAKSAYQIHLASTYGTRNNVVPQPFEAPILLLHTHIAGTTHLESLCRLLEIAESRTEPRLMLLREPNNSYDKYAVIIATTDCEKLGFIPRRENRVIARLLDGGKELFATITKSEIKGSWLFVRIDVFMS